MKIKAVSNILLAIVISAPCQAMDIELQQPQILQLPTDLTKRIFRHVVEKYPNAIKNWPPLTQVCKKWNSYFSNKDFLNNILDFNQDSLNKELSIESEKQLKHEIDREHNSLYQSIPMREGIAVIPPRTNKVPFNAIKAIFLIKSGAKDAKAGLDLISHAFKLNSLPLIQCLIEHNILRPTIENLCSAISNSVNSDIIKFLAQPSYININQKVTLPEDMLPFYSKAKRPLELASTSEIAQILFDAGADLYLNPNVPTSFQKICKTVQRDPQLDVALILQKGGYNRNVAQAITDCIRSQEPQNVSYQEPQNKCPIL